MLPPIAPPSTVDADRLAAVYQLKIHLVGISPQIVRRVLVLGTTTLFDALPRTKTTRSWPGNTASASHWSD